MAKGKTTTISKIFLNNSKTPTSLANAVPVEMVVKDNMLVVDDKDVNPGVVINSLRA